MDLSKWVGIPFADRGRTLAGADCWGLACLVYAEALFIALPSYADEYRELADRDRHDLHRVIQAHRGEWREIEPGKERGGDIVILRVAGAASHIGIVARTGQMLTVRRDQASAIESYRSIRWRSRVDAFLRHKHAEF